MLKRYTITNPEEFLQKQNLGNDSWELHSVGDERMQVSDGRNTMDELYEHRYALWIKICKIYLAADGVIQGVGIEGLRPVWRARLQDEGEGELFEDYFILSIGKDPENQISYWIPIEKWEETKFAETLDPVQFDKYKTVDVLERLKLL